MKLVLVLLEPFRIPRLSVEFVAEGNEGVECSDGVEGFVVKAVVVGGGDGFPAGAAVVVQSVSPGGVTGLALEFSGDVAAWAAGERPLVGERAFAVPAVVVVGWLGFSAWPAVASRSVQS